jgi:hypothetical protein
MTPFHIDLHTLLEMFEFWRISADVLLPVLLPEIWRVMVNVSSHIDFPALHDKLQVLIDIINIFAIAKGLGGEHQPPG